jgi:hypothetical protein
LGNGGVMMETIMLMMDVPLFVGLREDGPVVEVPHLSLMYVMKFVVME